MINLFAATSTSAGITFVKSRIVGIEILRIERVLRNTHCITETLKVNDFALTQKANRIAHIWVVYQPQNIVIGRACLLLWCNHIRANFSEIPMNFYGNIPGSLDSLADRYVINQRFHNFAVKMFQVCVLSGEFAAVITYRNFFVDFG